MAQKDLILERIKAVKDTIAGLNSASAALVALGAESEPEPEPESEPATEPVDETQLNQGVHD